jgi:hypothetical protein
MVMKKVECQSVALELKREQADVLAHFERDREIEELPEGLETAKIRSRRRGARTDADCIYEICELIARGITATAASHFVAVPWSTWQSWLRKNHEHAREIFDFAYMCHLDAMADKTLLILDQLEDRREAALKKYHAAHRAWRKTCAKAKSDKRLPKEPIYEGPTEWDLKMASNKVKARQWHLERRHEKFASTSKQILEQRGEVTISHDLNLRRDPREAMREYIKLIDAGSE